MNKKILFAIVLILSSFSQSFAGRLFKFGGQIGVNLPYYSISNTASKFTGTVKDLNNLTGFHLGPVLEIEPIKYLSINTALLFNYNSIELNYSPSSIPTESQVEKDVNKMFSLQVPVLLEGRYPFLKVLAVYGEMGPYAEWGFLAMAKQTYKNATSESDYSSFDYNQLDYGLKFGMGVEVLFFKLGASYGFGFQDHTFKNNMNIQNRMLQFHLAIR